MHENLGKEEEENYPRKEEDGANPKEEIRMTSPLFYPLFIMI